MKKYRGSEGCSLPPEWIYFCFWKTVRIGLFALIQLGLPWSELEFNLAVDRAVSGSFLHLGAALQGSQLWAQGPFSLGNPQFQFSFSQPCETLLSFSVSYSSLSFFLRALEAFVWGSHRTPHPLEPFTSLRLLCFAVSCYLNSISFQLKPRLCYELTSFHPLTLLACDLIYVSGLTF